MDTIQIEAAIEAILFTMGEAVEVGKLAEALELDKKTTRNVLAGMMSKYEAEDRGIRILELEGSVQLCTKVEYYDCLIRIAKQPKKHVLTDVVLETLSIIAYKQPVTRIQVEQIRGVKSDHAINKLIEYGLIEEVGRLDAPGRPILFGTTEEFLRNFGIRAVSELPRMSQDDIENFREEAEEEIQLRLPV